LPSPTARASIATTMHCEPKRSDAVATSRGSATAELFRDTLSAPSSSSTRTSMSLRTPPPTVNGMNTSSAVRDTMS
jgi:hypothetical protein